MDITLEYHVCLRLKFREKVAKGLLGKLFRSKDEARHRRKRTLKEKLWRSFTDTFQKPSRPPVRWSRAATSSTGNGLLNKYP